MMMSKQEQTTGEAQLTAYWTGKNEHREESCAIDITVNYLSENLDFCLRYQAQETSMIIQV